MASDLNRRALLGSAASLAVIAVVPIPARRVLTYTPECYWGFEAGPCTLSGFDLEQLCEWFDVPPHLVMGRA
jgi:hypothetical protein